MRENQQKSETKNELYRRNDKNTLAKCITISDKQKKT